MCFSDLYSKTRVKVIRACLLTFVTILEVDNTSHFSMISMIVQLISVFQKKSNLKYLSTINKKAFLH